MRERPERPSQPKDKDKDKYQCSVNVGGSGGGGMAMVDLVQWREDEDGVVLGGSGDDDCDLGGRLDDDAPPLGLATSPSALDQPATGRGRGLDEAVPPPAGDQVTHS